jgi:enediyne biosynthesis protein E4
MQFSLDRLGLAVVLVLFLPSLLGGEQPAANPRVKAGAPCAGKVTQFEDITAKTGITFSHVVSPEKKYIFESMSAGVLLVDYDRDGWLDIYFTNAPTIGMLKEGKTARGALYHNNHDGTFTDVTDKAGVGTPCFAMGGAVGDYNNDGWPDLYITCLQGNVLYRNNGDGTFTNVAKEAGVVDGRFSTGAAFGDYDHDGNLDLMVASYIDFDINNLPSFGKRQFCKLKDLDVQCGPRGLKGATDALFHNNGDGTFTDVSKQSGMDDPAAYYGMTPIWSDFDRRGEFDLYLADDSTPSYFYRNKDRKTFDEIGLESGTALNGDGSEQGGMGVTVGDYLHTGYPAIFKTNFEGEYNVLYRNDGHYNFKDVSFESGLATISIPYVGWGTWFADFDNDGWLDLMVVNGHVYPQVDTVVGNVGYKQPKFLFMNQHDGTFCDASKLAGPALMEKRPSRGAAFGDLFNDGHIDVVVEDIDGGPMVLRNRGDDGNHWITLELASPEKNRLAIGALVKAVAGDVVQTEEVHSGGSYISQNDLRVHFGLGQATKADLIEIHWSSGRVEKIQNLAADHFYSVMEGEGVVPFERIRPTTRH